MADLVTPQSEEVPLTTNEPIKPIVPSVEAPNQPQLAPTRSPGTLLPAEEAGVDKIINDFYNIFITLHQEAQAAIHSASAIVLPEKTKDDHPRYVLPTRYNSAEEMIIGTYDILAAIAINNEIRDFKEVTARRAYNASISSSFFSEIINNLFIGIVHERGLPSLETVYASLKKWVISNITHEVINDPKADTRIKTIITTLSNSTLGLLERTYITSLVQNHIKNINRTLGEIGKGASYIPKFYEYIKSGRTSYLNTPSPLGQIEELLSYDIDTLNMFWERNMAEAISRHQVQLDRLVNTFLSNQANWLYDRRASLFGKVNNALVEFNINDQVQKRFEVLLNNKLKGSDFEKTYAPLTKYFFNEKGDDIKKIISDSIIRDMYAHPFDRKGDSDKNYGMITINSNIANNTYALLKTGLIDSEQITQAMKTNAEALTSKILNEMDSGITTWYALKGPAFQEFIEYIETPEFKNADRDEQKVLINRFMADKPMSVLNRFKPGLQLNKPAFKTIIKNLKHMTNPFERRYPAEDEGPPMEYTDDNFQKTYMDLKREMLVFRKSYLLAGLVGGRRSMGIKIMRDIGQTFEALPNFYNAKPAESYDKNFSNIKKEDVALGIKDTVINTLMRDKLYLPLKELGEELEKLQIAYIRSVYKDLNKRVGIPDITAMAMLFLTQKSAHSKYIDNSVLQDINIGITSNDKANDWGKKLALLDMLIDSEVTTEEIPSNYIEGTPPNKERVFLIAEGATPEERRTKATKLAQLIFEILTKDLYKSEYEYEQRDMATGFIVGFNSLYNKGIPVSAILDASNAFCSIIHDNDLSNIHGETQAANKKVLTTLSKNINLRYLGRSEILEELYDIYAKLSKYRDPNFTGGDGAVSLSEAMHLLLEQKTVTKSQIQSVNTILQIIENNQPISFVREELIKLQALLRDGEFMIQALTDTAFTEFLEHYEPKDKMVIDAVEWEQPQFRFRCLPEKSPQYFTIGIQTDCCQHLGGAARNAAIDSFINKLAGVLVLEVKTDDDWVLAGQSYFHYVPNPKGYILDNVEGVENVLANVKSLTGHDTDELYHLWATHMKKTYPDLTYLVAGKSYTKIPENRFAKHSVEEDPRTFHPYIEDEPYSDYDEEDSMDLLKFDSGKVAQNEALDEDEEHTGTEDTEENYHKEMYKVIESIREDIGSSGITGKYYALSNHTDNLKQLLMYALAIKGIDKPKSTPIEELEKLLFKPIDRKSQLIYRANLYIRKIMRGKV